MNKLNLLFSIVVLFIASSTVFGQPFTHEKALKHFDLGMMIIENAKNTEDYKKAIKEFENAYYEDPGWADPIYNLGLLYDKIEDYLEAKHWLSLYLLKASDADDKEEVKSMINEVDFKYQQMQDPKTLSGIWYWSRPKASCEPRLEIRVENGTLKARALYSEGTESNNQLNAERDPGVYIAKGNLVPLGWNEFEMKLSVIDAPYFACGRSIAPDMCPSTATFYLVRKGMNRLEGKLIKTETIYPNLDEPEIFKAEVDAVFERDE